ncbi:MAG: proprotein convertase P-domain-containing protein [Deltaproteobacteria bacterium]|nr:proprotein convertase P-domain-containing protein [Deltaproteobacteria bacterium]
MSAKKLFSICMVLSIAGLSVFSGCGSIEQSQNEMSKDQARKLVKADWWDDLCEYYNWYGDGICDSFCPLPDPDCAPSHPTDHRPYCGQVATSDEGWYWGDTEELIKQTECSGLGEAECMAIGSRSEGWVAEAGLITWDRLCHTTIGVALWGEACGGSIGQFCYTEKDLYCQGLPPGGSHGGSGVCKTDGSCEVADDCLAEGNDWTRPRCIGYPSCEDNTCAWHCEQPNQGAWSWTTVLLAEVESEHPYPDNFERQWVVERKSAAKIKIHFSKIELEQGYDWITISGLGEESALIIEGSLQDYWTPEFDGDTLLVSLHSDYSINYWGFAVDSVSYFEQLPAGVCNVNADCQAGYECFPHNCINPYAPCHGECRPIEDNQGGTFSSADTPIAIPDATPAGITSQLEVISVPDCELEVSIDLTILHSYSGDLLVGLTDPSGVRTVLHDRQGGSADDVVLQGHSLTGLLGGNGTNGLWTLDVSDHASLDFGTLESWSITLLCE